MLNDGLNGPNEWDRASVTIRKKSDVISPGKQNKPMINIISKPLSTGDRVEKH
jgi:hypothetical protein